MREGFYYSGKLAALAGVSADTLRHYERKGVLLRPRRGANGYREYPAEALQRVQLIRRALAFGFTLDELAGILRVRDRGGAPCVEVRDLAASKLANLETRLRELTELRDELRTNLRDWNKQISRRPAGERAHLLETLAKVDHGKPETLPTHLNLRPKSKRKKEPK